MINIHTLTRLARQVAGLELILYTGFHEFYQQEILGALPGPSSSSAKELFYRMRVLDSLGSISDAQWEAIGLYSVFAFRKVQ